jgi:hypothetical protein
VLADANNVKRRKSVFRNKCQSLRAVVLAKARIHNHRPALLSTSTGPSLLNSIVLWPWVPAGACHRAAQSADPVAGTTPRNVLADVKRRKSVFRNKCQSFRAVILAKARIHNHRPALLPMGGGSSLLNHIRLWLWVPAFALLSQGRRGGSYCCQPSARILAAQCVRVLKAKPPSNKREGAGNAG